MAMRSGSKTVAAQVKLDDAQCFGWSGAGMRPGVGVLIRCLIYMSCQLPSEERV
jgi:hypothetical protein